MTDARTEAAHHALDDVPRSRRDARRRRLWPAIGGAGLAVMSLLLPGGPTYDPWAWLIWGREVLDLDLDTTAGPAWKPLPVMLTTAFSLFGDLAPFLWLVVSRAGALLAVAMAYRLAARVGGPLAGVAAALSLLLSADFLSHFVPLGMSEPLLMGLALFAIERHLAGHVAHAYSLALAAALLRPEVWPFLVLYALWLWRRLPDKRLVVVAAIVAVPVLWFAPELWGSGDLFRSSKRIMDPTNGGPLLTSRPGWAVIVSAWPYLIAPFNVAVVVAVSRAVVVFLRRREEVVMVALAACAASWLVLVAVMAELRVAAGERRFLCVAAAIACVLAGIGFAHVVEVGGELVRRLSGNDTAHAGRAWTVLLVVAVSIPAALPRAERIVSRLDDHRPTGKVHRDLVVAVDEAGGPAGVLSCGRPAVDPLEVPHLAWVLGAHIRDVVFDDPSAGIVFHMPAPTDDVSGSSWHPGDTGYDLVATAGVWEVWARCDRRPAGLSNRPAAPAARARSARWPCACAPRRPRSGWPG